MAMAHLPAVRTDSSLTESQIRIREKLVELFAKGMKPPEIARRMAKGDIRKYKRLRQRIWRMVTDDKVLREMIFMRARTELDMGLVPAAEGLARRAARGRVAEAKLLFESTGFYTARTSHEHTGEIKISLSMPRPPAVSVDGEGEEITDAEVVE